MNDCWLLPPSAGLCAGGTGVSVSPVNWSVLSSAGPVCAAGTSSLRRWLLSSAGRHKHINPDPAQIPVTDEAAEQQTSHLLLQDGLVLLHQFVGLGGEAVPLVLQLFVQLQLVLVHLRLQLVLQPHQLLLVLPPHSFVPGHLLPQRRALLVFLDLTGHLEDR